MDGDIYFVCWDSDLVPPLQEEPMDYTAAKSTELDHDVTIEVVFLSFHSFCSMYVGVLFQSYILLLIFCIRTWPVCWVILVICHRSYFVYIFLSTCIPHKHFFHSMLYLDSGGTDVGYWYVMSKRRIRLMFYYA